MAHLTSLPVEILILIAKLLKSTQDCLNLAACCKSLRGLLLPEAFRSIEIASQCIASLSQLVHVLAADSSLGAAVRSISIPRKYLKRRQKPRFDSAQISITLQRITHTEEELTKWREELKGYGYPRCEEDAWWGILLALVPNLKILEVRWQGELGYRVKMIGRAARQEKPFDSQPAYTRLELIEIRRREHSSPMRLVELLPLFTFPSVQSILCDGIADWTEEEQYIADQELRGYSNVKKIRLLDSSSHRGFVPLIRACTRLEEFICLNALPQDRNAPWNPPVMWKALAAHQSTLETISFSNPSGYSGPGPSADDFFGSLTNFTKLSLLSLDAMNILDWDAAGEFARNDLTNVLPRTLEMLYITEFHRCPNMEQLTDQLHCFMESSVPCLKQLNIEGFLCETDWSGDLEDPRSLTPEMTRMAAILDTAAQANGVRLQLATCRSYDPSPGCTKVIPSEFYRRPVPMHSASPRQAVDLSDSDSDDFSDESYEELFTGFL
ncbi:hypothetical protein BDW74DRAFT_177816 [Aspergillus multicolor]|uniref:uncharacterized protein n=1 Tax=Aspergillus multicolor TaxID=41759 RepID=UPI003CCDACDC